MNETSNGMWYLQNVTITTSGEITDPTGLNTLPPGNYNGCRRRSIFQTIMIGPEHLCTIDAPVDWSYACTEMDPFWFNQKPNGTKESPYLIGFQFFMMQVMLLNNEK